MAQSKRKFYQTKIVTTVLSEEPFEWDNLNDVAYAISRGDCSGHTKECDHKVLTAKQVVKALQAQGSEPGFFQLDDDGKDVE